MRYLVIILLIVLIGGCSEPDNRSESTLEMVEYLKAKSDTAKRSISYPYYSDYLVKRLQFMLNGMPYRIKVGQRLDYGLALLMKGNNQLCIKEMNKAINALPQREKISSKNVYFHKILALAHLREGEQVNCIDNHNEQSCVIPLNGGGIHQNKQGAEAAIEIYQKLLDYDPKDYQSKWFLNLSHMANGTYPNCVPQKYLIDQSKYEDPIPFKRFENVGMSAKVAINNHAGGSITEDFNNDGLIDIYTTSYSLSEDNYFLKNLGKGTFEDKSKEYGITGLTAGLNAVQGDFNNDGFEDVIVSRGAWLGSNGKIRNSLLMNVNGNQFQESNLKSGLDAEKPTGAVAVADVDLDGDLDVFFGNEGSIRNSFPSELMLNDGTGKFSNVSIQVNLNVNDFVKGANWGDVNKDGYPDLILSIYGGKNLLFMNRTLENNGKLKFQEIGLKAGIQEPIFSFPCWFWDYDNDGLEDIIIFGYDNRNSQFIPEYVLKNMEDSSNVKDMPRLFKNIGNEQFEDVTNQVGLNLPIYAMGANYGDLNNDGYLDFYTGTGEFNLWAQIPNRMFLNQEGKSFTEVTYSGGFGQIQKGHGISFADLDNDGDQDIYHQVGGAAESDVFHNMLFENPGFEKNWISIDLSGSGSNRSAIGANIKLSIKSEDGSNREIYHKISSGGSFGANSLRAEIGIGNAQTIDSLWVGWPNANRTDQLFTNVIANQFYSIEEGDDSLKVLKLNTFQFNKEPQHSHMAMASTCGN